MSTRVVGKNARLYFGPYQLFLRLFEMELGIDINSEESSVYFDDWKKFETIDAQGNFSITGRFDEDGLTSEQVPADTLDDIHFQRVMTDNVPMIMIPDGLSPEGKPAYFGNFVQGSIALQMPRGGLGSVRVSAQSDARLGRGLCLACRDVTLLTTVDQFFPTAGYDLGSVGYLNGIVAAYSLFKRTGTLGTTIAVQADDVGGAGGSWLDRKVFANQVGAGAASDMAVVDLNATEKFHRLRIRNTTTGTETVSVVAVSGRY